MEANKSFDWRPLALLGVAIAALAIIGPMLGIREKREEAQKEKAAQEEAATWDEAFVRSGFQAAYSAAGIGGDDRVSALKAAAEDRARGGDLKRAFDRLRNVWQQLQTRATTRAIGQMRSDEPNPYPWSRFKAIFDARYGEGAFEAMGGEPRLIPPNPNLMQAVKDIGRDSPPRTLPRSEEKSR